MEEVRTKLERVRTLMAERGLDAVWLRRVESVAWITGGVDVAVNIAGAAGIAGVVITPGAAVMLTNTIEAPRLRAEDGVEARGFELRTAPWEGPEAIPESGKLGVDLAHPGAADLSRDLARLRARLLPVEQERFRRLGADCADAMRRAIGRAAPGRAEIELAAAVDYELRIRGVTPIVVLVAVDDRVFHVRHPIPTRKVMDRYAMLVLCGRRRGLVCSLTRLVHVGPLSDDLRRRMEANAEVDSAMIAASRPGASLEDIFRVAQAAYARAGFPDEWKLHHQGGVAGYTPREAIAAPGEDLRLEAGMACAWNPSISGVKMEDTILVPRPEEPPEILTRIPGWPVRIVDVEGARIERPAIMEIRGHPRTPPSPAPSSPARPAASP